MKRFICRLIDCFLAMYSRGEIVEPHSKACSYEIKSLCYFEIQGESFATTKSSLKAFKKVEKTNLSNYCVSVNIAQSKFLESTGFFFLCYQCVNLTVKS